MSISQWSKLECSGWRALCVVIVSLSFLCSACAAPRFQSQSAQSNTNNGGPSGSLLPSLSPSASASQQSNFQRGMIYPRWHQDSYGASDTTWQQGIQMIKAQTGATWLEIPVLFSQATSHSTTVEVGPSTPSLEAFAHGIRSAHQLGYRVFFIPLMGVNVPGDWSGVIQFDTRQQEQAWFDSYWNTVKSYARVAQDNGVEQMAIGTELQWLQQYAPASLWEGLIGRMHSVFKGPLTYDMNWPSLYQAPQSWLKDPNLAMIGVSVYISLVDTPIRVDPKAISGLWRDKIRKLLDTLSAQTGKRILITEIGYRNTSDTLYNPWNSQSSAPQDPTEQAAAFDATLSNVFADSAISGIFFWGWDDVGRLGIKGQPAIQVLHKWYI